MKASLVQSAGPAITTGYFVPLSSIPQVRVSCHVCSTTTELQTENLNPEANRVKGKCPACGAAFASDRFTEPNRDDDPLYLLHRCLESLAKWKDHFDIELVLPAVVAKS